MSCPYYSCYTPSPLPFPFNPTRHSLPTTTLPTFLSFPCNYPQPFFSKNSFASLTLVAKYGLPPRSGWFSIMSVRWFLRMRSLVIVLSLRFSISIVFAHLITSQTIEVSWMNGSGRAPELQYQRRLSPIHLWLKTTLIKRLSERSHSALRAAVGNYSCSAL